MKFNDSNETVYRCNVRGKVMTRIELPLEAVR